MSTSIFPKTLAEVGMSGGTVPSYAIARRCIAALVLTFAASSAFGQSPAPTQARTARITNQPPDGLQPEKDLSAQDRRDNLEALWRAVDVSYAHFELKPIDWDDVGRRYRSRLDDVRGDDDYYRLLSRMIGELHDTHSWLQNYRLPPVPQVSSVAVDVFDSRPFVVAVSAGSDAERAGVKPGWEIVSVDRLTPDEKMQALRPLLPGFSSERAFRREAMRRLLAADSSKPATVVLRAPDGELRTVTLPRATGPTARRPVRTPAFELTRNTDVEFGVHPSGVGYIRIASFSRREELDRAFDAALAALRDTPALILDIRDNSGGFSHPWIVGRFLERRTQTYVAFIKDGDGHSALRTQPGYDAPSGSWQYTRRVVLLVNDLTGSAADLFTTELRSAKRVTVVGSTTHGNLSGTAAYAVLPCQLVVRISNGYVAGMDGRSVEVHGNAPDVLVEPTLDDVLGGHDPVLERAVGLLISRP